MTPASNVVEIPKRDHCAECGHTFTTAERRYGYSKGDGLRHKLCWTCVQKILTYFGSRAPA